MPATKTSSNLYLSVSLGDGYKLAIVIIFVVQVSFILAVYYYLHKKNKAIDKKLDKNEKKFYSFLYRFHGISNKIKDRLFHDKLGLPLTQEDIENKKQGFIYKVNYNNKKRNHFGQYGFGTHHFDQINDSQVYDDLQSYKS